MLTPVGLIKSFYYRDYFFPILNRSCFLPSRHRVLVVKRVSGSSFCFTVYKPLDFL